MRRDEDRALAQDGVPAEAGPAGDQREVIGGVPRCGNGIERSEAHAFGEPDVDLSATGRQRRGMAREQLGHRFGVIFVIVCQRHAAEAAATLDRGQDPAQVRVDQRPRVHDPRRFAAHDPRIRARQRQRSRVRRAHAQDVIAIQQVGIGSRIGLRFDELLLAGLLRQLRIHLLDVNRQSASSECCAHAIWQRLAPRRSSDTAITSQHNPSRAIAWITSAEMSGSRQLRPWLAEVGKA